MQASHEKELSRVEAQTRLDRPPTDTIGRALRTFFAAPSVLTILFLTLLTIGLRIVVGEPARPVEYWIPVGVLLFWPVQEWAAHRWILHLQPRSIAGITVDPYFARRHRKHHANPSYFPDVFLPARVVLLAWVVIAVAGYLITNSFGITCTLLLAMSIASVIYEWAHFIAHTDLVPRAGYVRRLVSNHRLHHYRNEQRWFAFTVPHLDQWLGTGGSTRSVPTSDTTRTLGVVE